MRKNILTGVILMGAITLHAANPPNIIIIFTDDQGYADLGIAGFDSDVRTPNLDQLARDGVLFTRGYVTAPQCAPSRAGLISCRHQNAFGLDDNHSGPLPLSESRTTIAARLQEVGYATGIVGKWSLAHDRERGDPNERFIVTDHLPHNFGFEEYWAGVMYRYHASHDLHGNPLRNPPQIVEVSHSYYRVDVQTEAALAFLDRRGGDDRPFFLYLPYFAPHSPVEDPPYYMDQLGHVKDHERRMGLASILSVDNGVGQIRRKLEEMGQADNTLIIYSSDNGAPLGHGVYIGSHNYPAVGEKGMLTDGGLRVPYIVTWPGKIPGGQVIDEMVSLLDASATALAVANAPMDELIEGVNLMPFMLGERGGAVHDALFWRWRSQSAIRSGNWTLLMLGNERRYLFDNRQMGSEYAVNNQIDAFPEIAANLEQKLRQHSESWKIKGLPATVNAADERFFDIHIDRSKPGTHPMQTPWEQEDFGLAEINAHEEAMAARQSIPELRAAANELHQMLADDFHRPLWHLGSLDVNWWDVNGLGYFDGRYHAMFMKSGHWGHAVSHDLLHWRFLPDAITHDMFSDGLEKPAFSGDMIDNAPQPTIIFYSLDRGIYIAIAKDEELREWELLTDDPVIPRNEESAEMFPEAVIFDPMAWYDEEEETYYALIGNRNHRPGYEGDGTSLFKTKNLIDWEYIGPLYKSRRDMTELYEDTACPDFFPLDDKWVLIAHLHETWTHVRWYVGDFDGTTFTPETMGRLSYLHHQMAAPETFLDGNGRRIFFGHHRTASVPPGLWLSHFSLPAELSIGEDNTLRFSPVEELEGLRYSSRTFEPMTVEGTVKLEQVGARSIELRARIDPGSSEAVGFRVLAAPDNSEFTDITYFPKEGILEFDFTNSDKENRVTYTRHRPAEHTLLIVGENPPVTKQRIPFTVPEGEDLDLHIFIDGCIIEVFANNRTFASQNVYPSRRDAIEAHVFSRGGSARLHSLEAHKLKATMNY